MGGCYYNHVNALSENLCLLLHTPAVRDLAWACFTPPLLHSAELACRERLANADLPLTPARCDWLQSLDRQPKALLQHLQKLHNQRLGLYFEALWQFFLQQDPEVELLAHNLPVRDGGRTVGEFDCLYFCHRRQRPIHLELAVKFYLRDDSTNSPAAMRWLGPNARDRLDLKLNRLLEHQVLLSRHPLGQEVLAGIGIEDPLLELEMKGRLYQPLASNGPPPPAYNTRQPLQQWSRAGEHWDTSLASDETFLPLRRDQWLAPALAEESPTQDAGALRAMLADKAPGRALQVAVLDTQGCERRRLFLVADAWPHL